MFFVRGTIETVKKLRWVPSVVNCSGWVTALAPLYMRRMYADDPTLKDSKIVYSIFNAKPVEPLDKAIVGKLKQDGFTDADLKPLIDAGEIDDIALGKLAIDFSDAVAVGVEDAPAELVEYAKATGKPILDYPGADQYVDKYREFFVSL